jgi:hypothetical protein
LVQQLLRLRLADLFEVGLDAVIAARLELPQQFPDRGCQAELGKHLRMQFGHRRAERGSGLLQRRVDRLQCRIRTPFAHLVEIQSGSEQGL